MTVDATPDFTRELRRELMSGAVVLERRRRRRRTAALTAGAMLILTVVTVTIDGVSSKPAAANVRVTTADGVVTLRLTGPRVEPGDIDLAARRAGLNATTRGVPVGPSLVGKLIRASSDRPLPSKFALLGRDGAFSGFRMPSSWPGTLRIDIGRTATKGERYVRASDAFAVGEPLACTGLLGHRLDDAEALFARHHLEVEVVAGSSDAAIEVPSATVVIGDAEVLGVNRLRVRDRARRPAHSNHAAAIVLRTVRRRSYVRY